jgi:hypothetical protein
MKQSDILFLCIALTIVVIICLAAGYMSSINGGNSGNSGNSPIQNAPEQTFEQPTSSQPLISVPTTPVTAAQAPTSIGLTVTVNSANVSSKYPDYPAKPGDTLLIVNVTLINNDPRHTVAFTSSSFDIAGNVRGISFVHPPSMLSGQFTDYLPPDSQETGDMVFKINPNAREFQFLMTDLSGTVIAQVDNITASAITTS